MKAVYLEKYGLADKAFSIRELARPAMKENQLRISVEGFGLNFADVLARRGLYRESPPLPAILGYEVVGRVVEQGPNVPVDMRQQRVLAITRFGGYAQEVTTDFRACVSVGEDTPAGELLALGTQGATAWYAANYATRLLEGEKVLVHAAAGGVGWLLTQLALNAGCEVFATAGDPDKRAFLQTMGAHHVIDYRNESYEKAITSILHKDRLQVSFNSLAGNTIDKDLNLLGSGGRLIVYGGASRAGKRFGMLSTIGFAWNTGLISPLSLMMRSKAIIGLNMLKLGDYRPEMVARCLHEVVEAYRKGQLKPHVGHVFPASEIAEAHHLLESRKTMGKVAMMWDL